MLFTPLLATATGAPAPPAAWGGAALALAGTLLVTLDSVGGEEVRSWQRQQQQQQQQVQPVASRRTATRAAQLRTESRSLHCMQRLQQPPLPPPVPQQQQQQQQRQRRRRRSWGGTCSRWRQSGGGGSGDGRGASAKGRLQVGGGSQEGGVEGEGGAA